MGMFDNIDCEFPLPGVPDDTVLNDFQTKSFENRLEVYTITKDGRLIHHRTKYESVPEEERPYFGTPKWEDGTLFQLCGCMKTLSDGDVELDITDTIRFYTSTGDYDEGTFVWWEFEARFENGRMVKIRRI